MPIKFHVQLEAIHASRVGKSGLLAGKEPEHQQRTECAGRYGWTSSAARGVIRINDDDDDDDVGKRILETSILNVRNQIHFEIHDSILDLIWSVYQCIVLE